MCVDQSCTRCSAHVSSWYNTQAEEAVKAAGFPYVSIYRPGLLDRSNVAETQPRPLEVALSKLVSKLPCTTLAKAIVNEAEARLREATTTEGVATQVVKVYTNPDIIRLSK